MNILLGIYDPFVLAGNVRVMYQIGDVLEELGHTVVVKSSDIRPKKSRYFEPDELSDYHPVDSIGNFFTHFEELEDDKYMWIILELLTEGDLDLAFFGRERWAYVGNIVPNPIFLYGHWPERPYPPNAEILCNSTFTEQEVKRRWKKNPKVLHPSVYLDRYSSNLDYGERDIDVISVGQLYFYKGFDVLTDVARDGYNVHLIGADVKNSVVPEDVIVHKNARFSKLSELLSRSKVFVHPTRREHFGIVVAEAMASGCPVVVHRSGGPWMDIINKGKYGLSFDSLGELKSNVRRLVDDKDEWRKYHVKSVKRCEVFSKDNFKDKLKGVLNGLRLDS